MSTADRSIAALVAALRDGLLMDNWKLAIETWKPSRPLADLVEEPEAMREEARAKAVALGWPEEAVDAIAKAFFERVESGLVASHAFALHLFRVDEDNWFSFARAVEASRWFAEPEYLADRRELWLAKGVRGREIPVLEGLCAPRDLPLVADLGAGELSFVLVGLAD